ncbi:MAG: APC family permease [Flavobacteriales bacterium]
MSNERASYNLQAATSIVVANMIGTGIFVSLGFQLMGIADFATIILLWLVGGIIALCGAFSYSELGAAMPESGGEYHFLSRIYHPALGFMSGWMSSTIGFAAPIAMNAMLFSTYFTTVFPQVPKTHVAISLMVLVTGVHMVSHRTSGRFQVWLTIFKVVLILAFIIAGMLGPTIPGISFMPTDVTLSSMLSSPFAVSLVYVSFAYSGWNATAYISSEVERPGRNLPLSIIFGTALVMVLYVLLNVVFLKTSPADELRVGADFEPKEIGFIAAQHIFNDSIGKILCIVICIFLVSSISSMVIAGPRVIQAIARDFKMLSFLGQQDGQRIPRRALIIQLAISIIIAITGTFDTVINYTVFCMTFFSVMTVFGVIIYRVKQPGLARPYKTFLYPLSPIVFILANAWFMSFQIVDKPMESLIGIGVIASGLMLYFVSRWVQQRRIHSPH